MIDIVKKLMYYTLFCIIIVSCSDSVVGKIKDDKVDSLEDKPNIILIVAESHRAEAIGRNGNELILTPNIDQLIDEGSYFSNMYVTSAICTSSRASIMSGQYLHNHKIADFSTDFSLEAWQNSLPMELKSLGYSLSWIGPFGVGGNPPKGDFDFWRSDIPWIKDNVHNTDLTIAEVRSFISEHDRKDPFFLCVNFNAAHEIDPTGSEPAHYIVQDRYNEFYEDIDFPFPETYNFWTNFPEFFRTEENIGRKRWEGFLSDSLLFQQQTRDYYRLIAGLDEAVGSIRKLLEENRIDDNTLIIYTSDHGFSLGEHGLMGKWYPFEVSIRVPLVIYDPRNTDLKNTVNHDIALNIDIAPTILSLIGDSSYGRMDGIDLFSDRIKDRDYFLYEHTFLGQPHLFKTKAIVSRDFKYVVFTENGDELFYDLLKNPEESDNLINSNDYSKEVQLFRNIYQLYNE